MTGLSGMDTSDGQVIELLEGWRHSRRILPEVRAYGYSVLEQALQGTQPYLYEKCGSQNILHNQQQ